MSSLTVENSEVFDLENYQKYKKDIWNSSYGGGLYFSAMEELGQELLINFGLKRKNESMTKWFKTPHALHDGYSALKILAKEKDFSLDLPRFDFKPAQKPFRAIISALKSSPKEAHDFKNQSAISNSTEFRYFRFDFPLHKQKVSDTAIFAKVVSQTLMNQLTNNKSSRWMIPVRLRDSDGLQASYIGLEVQEGDSIQALHKKLVENLKSGQHWGFYYLSKIGLLLGKRAILNLTKKNVLKPETIWMGVLSNLGDLGVSKELDELTVLAPVRWHRPVGAIIYRHNDRQVLTVCIHNSLQEVSDDQITRSITEAYESYL